MFTQLHEAQRYREAAEIIRYYSQCLDRIPHTRGHVELTCGYWVSMTQVLLSIPQLPPLVKADVMRQLADKGDEVLNDVEIIRLEDEAIAIYKQEGHTVGATLIRCQRIIREGKRDPTLFTPAVFQEMERHFATYEAFQAIHMWQVTVANLVRHIPREWRRNSDIHRFCVTSKRVAGLSGNVFAGLDAQKYAIDMWLTWPGAPSRALQLCTTLYAILEGRDNRLDQGMVAHGASKAHMQLKDWTMAEEWAQKAAAAWADGFPTLRVGAVDSVIQAKIGEGFWNPDALEDLLRYVEEETMFDERHNQTKCALPRMRMIEHTYNMLREHVQARAVRDVEVVTRLGELREKISVLVKTVEVRHASLLRERAIKLAKAVDNPVLMEWEACMNNFNKAANLFRAHCMFPEAGKTRLRQSHILFKKFGIDYDMGPLLRCHDLVEIAIHHFAISECLQSVTQAQHWKSALLQAAWKRGKLPGHAVLEALRDAEGAWARERSDVSKFVSLAAKSRPRDLTPFQELQTIYLRAFDVCLEDKKPQELWNWVQREKVRSLCDQLGAESPLCAEVRDRSLSWVQREE
ncbi:hypothetical protein E4U58_002711 [Claviceps cyperi]|nr:hypothetical protein E4U58_002711 [Claviceps cyperi]